VGSEQGERDPLEAEPETCGMDITAVRKREPMRMGEVVLVVVERDDGGRLRAGDLHQDLEFERLLPLAASIRPLRPKKGSVAMSEAGSSPSPPSISSERSSHRFRHSTTVSGSPSRTISR
jgi:hypothetical protein